MSFHFSLITFKIYDRWLFWTWYSESFINNNEYNGRIAATGKFSCLCTACSNLSHIWIFVISSTISKKKKTTNVLFTGDAFYVLPTKGTTISKKLESTTRLERIYIYIQAPTKWIWCPNVKHCFNSMWCCLVWNKFRVLPAGKLEAVIHIYEKTQAFIIVFPLNP